MTEHRGLDGLTAEELSASRRGFWDERFTGVLLSFLPASTEVLVDVGCGLATAAHALLPALLRARYLGIDADEARLSKAREHLRGLPYATRVELRVGRAEQLPVPDASAGVVLTAMTLQHLEVPGAGLSEARRVLTVGGVFLAVEPDNLANRFYFDGPLEEVNGAFAALFGAVREKRRPADVAIGPEVPRHAAGAGLEVTGCLPHFLGAIRPGRAGDFLRTFTRVAEVAATSGALLPDDQRLTACRVALAEVRARVGDDRPGFGGQVVPVFLTVARRAS